MSFMDLATERYSCRKYADKEVPQELIDQIVACARLAPTAVNRQPFHLYHMKSEHARQAIKDCVKTHFDAPEFLVLAADPELAWTRKSDNFNFAVVDTSIVGTFIMMQIKDLGLDTCWVGWFDEPALKAACPEFLGRELIAIFPLGYAAIDAEPSDNHFIRKDTTEFYTEL